MELFLFVCTIMQHFSFKSLQKPQEMDMDISLKFLGFIRIPSNYTLSFVPP
jgi:hypothetical protein